MTHKKCQLCSQLSSKFKKILDNFFGSRSNCQKIHKNTYDSTKRVLEFNTAAPDCSCESFITSKYSLAPVASQETIARFVFSPLFIDKKGKIKPNIFSHVFTVGCSVQRDDVALDNELIVLTSDSIARKNENAWEGVLLARCSDLREITTKTSNNRAVCIYDTAEKENPAHAEISQAQHPLSEDDITELRHDIFVAFGNGKLTSPNSYRNGNIWNSLPTTMQRPTKFK